VQLERRILIIIFSYSFGYECQKRFNLCVAEPNILIFASGNLIHFFNVNTKNITFRRCSTGCGIGFITVGIQNMLLIILDLGKHELCLQ
jgi:hypothetical protein